MGCLFKNDKNWIGTDLKYWYAFIVEKGLRGCVSVITHRKGVANNKYMKKYDEKKPSTFVLYLDLNNLYGWVMGQSMPF